MKEIKIVEYRPELAAAVADMWNRSNEGWGGGTTMVTAEYVAQQEANSDNINLYLAMEGDEVVGYCGLSEYKDDEGSLYIPLLNVVPDYYGKKLGKKLLLKALVRTVQLGWPRLDLYTWPGNTKAVPLYKKCGFFWEERDEVTHLMNFIPTVLNTDVVKDFFKEIDWYKDSKRIIEVEPDGRKENGFDYYQYQWETEQSRLRMEFERRGRGLRLIETDDFLISATVEAAELVFGKEYKVFYNIINKSGKALEIILKGETDKNIEFDFEEEMTLGSIAETRIEAKFKVGEIEEEQSGWRTHPTVTTKIFINGKETCFKVGIVPKFPVKISTKAHGNVGFIGGTDNFYLDIENNFGEKVDVTIDFPEVDFVEIQKKYQIALEGGEKKSIVIPYTLKDYGFYGEVLDINIKLSNGDTIGFKKKVGVGFKGFGASFSGEGEDFWHIYNGAYEAALGKFNNTIFMGRTLEGEPTRIMVPKLGKPFSSEFNKKRPDLVDFYEEKGAMVLKAIYNSTAFQQLQMIIYVKLYSEGIIEQTLEVKNASDTETCNEVWVNHPVFQKLYKTVLPYDDGIIELEDSIGSSYSDWESSRLTENWIFAKGEKNPRGICWSPKYRVNFASWFMFFEYSLGKLMAGESIETEPLYISIGAYQEWEDFRRFALRKLEPTSKKVNSHLELTLNQHNPVLVKDSCTATLKSNRSEYFNGDLEINLLSENTPQLMMSFKPEEEIKEVTMDININRQKSIEVVSLEGNIFIQQRQLKGILLHQGNGEIVCKEVEEEGMKVYSVDNGEIQIKAAPEFFPCLYSMSNNGFEWLDHSFPATKAKSWWNPLGGGNFYYMEGISFNSLKKEVSKAEFVTLKDQHQNEWRGIKLETELEQHKEYKGLQWNQYFLMLPNIPVVCSVMEIVQETGKFLPQTKWEYYSFLNLLDEEGTGWFKSFGKENPTTYGIGKGAVEIKEYSSVVCGKKNRFDMQQIVTDLRSSSMELYMNREVSMMSSACRMNLENGERVFTTPIFHIFTDTIIPEDALKDLRNIRFEV